MNQQTPANFDRSILAPLDVKEEIKVFHEKRLAIQERVQKINADYQIESTRAQEEFDAATLAIAEVLHKSGVLAPGTPFILDTRFFEEHGHAYIKVSSEYITPAVLRKTH